MNRNVLLGWALLMLLFFGWTKYKGDQAQKELAARKADSLAEVAKHPVASAPALSAPVSGADATAKPRGKDSTSAAAALTSPADSGSRAGAIAHRAIRVVTPFFTAVLDNQGARVSELDISDLDGKPVYNKVLIRPDHEGALTLTLDNQDLGGLNWSVDTQDSLIQLGDTPVTVTFSTPFGKGTVQRKYTFRPDVRAIHHETILPPGVGTYALEWKGGLEETEEIATGRGIGLTSGFLSEFVYDNGVSVQRWKGTGEKTINAESGITRWLGMRRKYVAVLLDFRKDMQDRIDVESWKEPELPKGSPQHYGLRIAGATDEGHALNFDFMVLPLKYDNLKAMGRNYEQILFSGWEWFLRADIWYVKLCGFVLKLLNLFHHWIPNYGIAIILLTLLVRLLTMPLSVTQIRQTSRMAEHQPEIKKIQEKYKGDRQKSQAELMAYYRKQGINPLAPVMGCLPALLQMPVFISLFNVLGRAVELHEMPFFGWIRDLSRPDVVLPSLQVPFFFPVGLTILPFFMAATMWAQMKMTIKDPNQKAMVWLMPIMMFVFSGSFPSGLVLYWTVSNIFTIAQTRIFKPKSIPIISGGKRPVTAKGK